MKERRTRLKIHEAQVRLRLQPLTNIIRRRHIMFRRTTFAVSLFALFTLASLVAAQTNGGALAHKPERGRNFMGSTNARLLPLLPLDNTSPIAGRYVDFSWSEIDSAARYRLELEDTHGASVFSMMLSRGLGTHRVPSSQLDGRDNLRWRVVALDQAGRLLAETSWRTLLPLSSECEIW